MRTALTHCCRHCEWQQTMVPHDGDSTTKECFDHCPWCRSLELLERRATRLEALVDCLDNSLIFQEGYAVHPFIMD